MSTRPANPKRTPETTTASRAGGGFDRALPHSLDAEQALLGAMLADSAAISDAITVLRDIGSEAFFLERHRELYQLVLDLWNDRRSIDGVVIKDELSRRGRFESLGGYEFLAHLLGRVPSASRAREYAAIVRDKHLLRRLIAAAHSAADSAYESAAPAGEILQAAANDMMSVTQASFTGGAMALPDLVREVFRQIDEREGRPITGEPTGYYELDELTSGLQPAELIIIAGRPSMGKTALGLNIAEHMACDAERPVLFFSLEMSSQQVAQRILCGRARVDSQAVRRGRQSTRDMQRMQAAADELRDRPLYIDDTSALTIVELRARARLAKHRYGIRAVFVDYLQLMRSPRAESRQQEVAEISRGLKALAKDLNVPVIAMAQLNRNPEDRTGNRPRMSDLRESGAIEQDADVISLLHRESYYKLGENSAPDDDAKAELIIAKQRNGPVDTIELRFNRQYTRFDNPTVGGRYGGYDGGARNGDVEFPA